MPFDSIDKYRDEDPRSYEPRGHREKERVVTKETTIQFKGGIHFGTHQAFNKEGLTATVIYPEGQEMPLPGNAMMHFATQMQTAKKLGLSIGDLTIQVKTDPEKMDRVLSLIHSGGE